jgi:hypothetical protein
VRLELIQGLTTTYTAAELTTIALAVVLVILLAVIAYRAWLRSRVTPDQRERRRCAHLVAIGKINDARLLEIRENLVFYSYAVRGVEYNASQDLSRFAGIAAFDFSGVSALSVKYDPRNPANSIVAAEEWSGLRGATRLEPESHSSH